MQRHATVSKRSLLPVLIALVTLGLPAAPSASPTVDPSGTIVFAAGDIPDGGGMIERSIYTISPDGSNRTRLTSDYDAGAPSWSPDGSKIVFTADPNGDWSYHLYVMDSDGSNVTQLTDTAVDEGAPAWSPDGTRIAFTQSLGDGYILKSIAADGSDETEIAVGGISASWSPDSSKLVFSDWDTNMLYTVNADGTGIDEVLDSNMMYEQSPAWSPDGNRIAFAGANQGHQIFVVNPNGNGLTAITSGGELKMDPTWSPDGSRIAYTEGYNSIETVKLDGSATTTVIPAGDEDISDLDWYGEAGNDNPHGCTLFSDKGGLPVFFNGTDGNDVICGTSDSDQIRGKAGDDEIYGEAGNDQLVGDQGNDVLYGDAGNDRLSPSKGKDRVVAGAGNDFIWGINDGQRDVINGGPGKDCALVDKGLDKTKNVETVLYGDQKEC